MNVLLVSGGQCSINQIYMMRGSKSWVYVKATHSTLFSIVRRTKQDIS